jgi:pimeloyl-ACP methyl ester carboxylesterase
MCGTSSALMRSDDVSMQTSFFRSSVRSLFREQFHEVSYAEWGSSGDLGPVICVHGLTRQGRDFDFLAMKLAERRYKVLSPDVVGRGHSGHLVNPLDYDLQQYVLDMTVLIASLRAEQVDWIGTSLGGMIGILMAGLSNSPINRLVVNDIGPDLPLQAVLRIGKYVRDAPDSFPTTEAAQAYFRNVLSPFGKLEDWQWRHLSDHSIRPNGQGGYRLHYDRRLTLGFQYPAIHSRKLWTAWERIKCPVLILRGADSDLLLPQTASEMIKRNSRATIVEIPGCGHAPPLLEGAQIDVIIDWLEQTARAKSVGT